MSENQAVVHVWVPELTATKGGIQAFSRDLVEALAIVLGDARVFAFSKNDRGRGKLLARPVEVRGFGKWPVFLRTMFFACGIIWRGLRDRPRLVIVAHLNFAIVGWVLKLLTGTPYWCTAYGIEAWNIGRKVRSLGLRKADLILAISNYTRRRVI